MTQAGKGSGNDKSASFFMLNTQQFKSLIDQVSRQGQDAARTDDQRGIRAPELDTVDFSKWRTWRERFVATVEINGWSNARVWREMAVCITGKARELILGINRVRGMRLNQNFHPVLAEIEVLIIPSSDSDMTRAQLASARKEPNEDILEWRSHIRVP